jgi:predicted Zn-dependent protease with MMP-like domain
VRWWTTRRRFDAATYLRLSRPILDYWCEVGEDLTHLVRHVLIHHFGLSDDDMDRLEQDA